MDLTSELAKLAAGRCWDGYEPVPGKGAYTDDSCRKIGGKKKKKQEKQAKSPAWQRKSGKNSKGGLNEKGRKSYERENPGSDLKAPVTGKVKPGGKAAKRRKSFCARMKGNKGPMKKPNGEPTRKALSLRKWKCGSDNQPNLKDDMIMEDQLFTVLQEKLAASCGSHPAPKKKKKKTAYKVAAHCHCDKKGCPKCDAKREKESALKGDQHKLDVDKDGKIESSDLKKLRGRGKNEKVALDELRLKLASNVIKQAEEEGADIGSILARLGLILGGGLLGGSAGSRGAGALVRKFGKRVGKSHYRGNPKIKRTLERSLGGIRGGTAMLGGAAGGTVGGGILGNMGANALNKESAIKDELRLKLASHVIKQAEEEGAGIGSVLARLGLILGGSLLGGAAGGKGAGALVRKFGKRAPIKVNSRGNPKIKETLEKQLGGIMGGPAMALGSLGGTVGGGILGNMGANALNKESSLKQARLGALRDSPLPELLQKLKGFGKKTALPAAGTGLVGYGVGNYHGYQAGKDALANMSLQDLIEQAMASKEAALRGDQHKLDVDKDGKIEGSDLKKLRGRGKTKKAVAAQLILEKVAADTSMTDMEKAAFLSAALKGLTGGARFAGRALQGGGNMAKYMGKGLQQGVTSGGNLSRANRAAGLRSRIGQGMQGAGGVAQRVGQGMQRVADMPAQMGVGNMVHRGYHAAKPLAASLARQAGVRGQAIGQQVSRSPLGQAVSRSPIMQGLGNTMNTTLDFVHRNPLLAAGGAYAAGNYLGRGNAAPNPTMDAYQNMPIAPQAAGMMGLGQGQ